MADFRPEIDCQNELKFHVSIYNHVLLYSILTPHGPNAPERASLVLLPVLPDKFISLSSVFERHYFWKVHFVPAMNFVVEAKRRVPLVDWFPFSQTAPQVVCALC